MALGVADVYTKLDGISTRTRVCQREAFPCMRVQGPPVRELILKNERIIHIA